MKIEQQPRQPNSGDLREVTVPLASIAAAADNGKAYATHSGVMGRRVPPVPPENTPDQSDELPSGSAPIMQKIQPPESSTVSQSDSRFIDITDLMPSRMGFYDFDRISIRPFSLLDVQKMHRAITEGSLRYQVDTIAACLDVSPYELTWGDFQFVQYWIFINSYKKHPKKINFSCTNPDHVAWVSEGQRPSPQDPAVLVPITEDSLDNEYVITKSDLTVDYLSLDVANDFLQTFHQEYGVFLWAPRVVDLVEVESDLKRLVQQQQAKAAKQQIKHAKVQEQMEEAINPKVAGYNISMDYANRYAVLLNPLHHGKTLAERRDFFLKFSETANPDLAVDMLTWESLCNETVHQYVSPVCKECGHTVGNVPYRIDPLAFLPNAVPK